MQVIVNDLPTSYTRAGSGRVLVLLHGWGDQASGFKDLQAKLSKNFDVIAPDLPGFGGSQAPEVVWGLEDYAKFVAVFLKKIGVNEVLAFVGHSNGGAIAIRGLANNLLESKKLVLLASAGIRGTKKGRVSALKYATKVGKALSRPLPRSTKQKLRSKLYKGVGSDMLVAGHLQETFKKIVAQDVRVDAAKLALPVILIYGEADTSTPVEFGEMYHELIEGSTLEVLPGAGHFVHLDRPHEVVQAINRFLK